MKALHHDFKHYLLDWLNAVANGYADIAYGCIVVLWIALCALVLHFLLHHYVMPLIMRFSGGWGKVSNILSSIPLFKRTAYLFQGFVVQYQSELWLQEKSLLSKTIDTTTNLWILLFVLLVIYALLDAIHKLIMMRTTRLQFPIRGLFQTIKLAASILVGLVSISILLDKSPLLLLSGLGALSAVVMLVFKDPILGLVAGIQLSANNMLDVGDWLEMPKYGADGSVLDIGLTTVKIQNWDKTITTIPTYALISDSFKNWRGMSESGGRRIKRKLNIDIQSIRFLNADDIQRLKSITLLSDYLKNKELDIARSNALREGAANNLINGRRLTNIGTFRVYIERYLKTHPDIHPDMTLLVRQLEPSGAGLPIQIYVFTKGTEWLQYEAIQSDIFDHLLAALGEFDLNIHQAPTGNDLRTLAS